MFSRFLFLTGVRDIKEHKRCKRMEWNNEKKRETDKQPMTAKQGDGHMYACD